MSCVPNRVLPLLALAAGALPVAMLGQSTLRYDLRPGDHLVYRERLERRVTGEDTDERVAAEWTTHVLAAGSCQGCVVTGFQRNRSAATLLRSFKNGRDTTAADQKTFAEQLATRPAVNAEANWITPSGLGLLPWSVTREWRGPVLPGLHELEPLPDTPVAPGASWTGLSLLGVRMTASACPDRGDADCVLLEGRSESARMRASFSRAQGLITRLSVSAEYGVSMERTTRDEVTFELVERRRQERVEDWVASPEVRAGALAALRISPERSIAGDRLYALLGNADADTERQVLAVAWRWHLAPPSAGTLDRLLGSPDPHVGRLAARLAGRAPSDETSAVPAAAGLLRRASGCAPAADRWSRARRFGREQPGATLRPMRSAGLAGWPYVVRIPDDYTGEHPVPMLVFLSGGPGLAITGAQAAEPALAATGYLAIYPQAGGLWWEERPHQVVRALIEEAIRTYNVDTDRVYLAGFSNGGTGALIYAARWPDRFAAVVPTMGAAVGPGSFPAFVSGLNTVPLLLIHGTDDRVIPVDQTVANRRRLERQPRSAPLDTVLLQGRDHDVTIASDEGRSLAFLAGRRRDPLPRTFVFETTDLTDPRRYWVEITAKDGGDSRVEVRVQPDGTIDIEAKRVRGLRLLLRGELLPADGPLVVRVNGREAFRGQVNEDCGLFSRSLEETADPGRAYSAVVELDLTNRGASANPGK